MHSMRRSIHVFFMAMIILINYVQSQSFNAQLAENSTEQQEELQLVQLETENPVQTTEVWTGSQIKEDNRLLKGGIGVQAGIRFHRPEEFNDFVSDVWNSIMEEKMYVPVDKKKIGPGLFMTLNGTFDIGNYFQAAPFAQGMWAGKLFRFRGGVLEDLHVNTLTAMGGLNLWCRVFNRDRFSIRLGAGGYGAYTIAYIKCDNSQTRLSGSGFGIKGLVGTELRLSRNVVLTMDCCVPWGITELKYQEEKLDYQVRYPDEFQHLGFEIVPGIMFYF